MIGLARWLVAGVVSVFLPSPERERVAEPAGVSPPLWSFWAGMIGGFVGLMLYMDGALAFMADLGGRQAMALLQSGQPIDDSDIRFGGLITWFAWHLQPQAWLYMYVSLTGLVRVIAFAAAQEAVAEPAIVVPMRWLQRRRRKAEAQGRLRELGPDRPDTVLEEEGSDLVVLSAREKEGWDEAATIAIGRRQYRLIDAKDRSDGRHVAIAYRLREADPGDAVRTIVRADIELPEGHAGGARRPAPGKHWYFAFGLTLEPETVSEVAGDVEQVCIAELFRHSLRFARPDGSGRGLAAAVPTENPSDIVWGVVWEIDETETPALDGLEGVGEGCSWKSLEVRDADGGRYVARVAITDADVRDVSLLPTREYRDQLLEIARRYPFSKIYLGLLGSSPAA